MAGGSRLVIVRRHLLAAEPIPASRHQTNNADAVPVLGADKFNQIPLLGGRRHFAGMVDCQSSRVSAANPGRWTDHTGKRPDNPRRCCERAFERGPGLDLLRNSSGTVMLTTKGGVGGARRHQRDGAKHFEIDDPLDPANEYLYHTSVESPDMMNIYNGTTVLDSNGEAEIQLPDWFEALNRDFRYQLSCIGGFAPVYVAREIENNTFRIAGGTSGLKVSWQVTGIRRDAYAEAHPSPVEVAKPAAERGHYLHPELFGASPDQAIGAH